MEDSHHISVVPPIYSALYAILLTKYHTLNKFNVSFGNFATFPITTAAAKSPRFSNPFCCAPSARTIFALVAWSMLWSPSVSRV